MQAISMCTKHAAVKETTTEFISFDLFLFFYWVCHVHFRVRVVKHLFLIFFSLRLHPKPGFPWNTQTHQDAYFCEWRAVVVRRVIMGLNLNDRKWWPSRCLKTVRGSKGGTLAQWMQPERLARLRR